MPARKDGKGFIYKITNKLTNKCYIGETGQASDTENGYYGYTHFLPKT